MDGPLSLAGRHIFRRLHKLHYTPSLQKFHLGASHFFNTKVRRGKPKLSTRRSIKKKWNNGNVICSHVTPTQLPKLIEKKSIRLKKWSAVRSPFMDMCHGRCVNMTSAQKQCVLWCCDSTDSCMKIMIIHFVLWTWRSRVRCSNYSYWKLNEFLCNSSHVNGFRTSQVWCVRMDYKFETNVYIILNYSIILKKLLCSVHNIDFFLLKKIKDFGTRFSLIKRHKMKDSLKKCDTKEKFFFFGSFALELCIIIAVKEPTSVL